MLQFMCPVRLYITINFRYQNCALKPKTRVSLILKMLLQIETRNR